jgi:hypothetical protein
MTGGEGGGGGGGGRGKRVLQGPISVDAENGINV